MKRLILVLGDQLSPRLSALTAGDPKTDIVVMAEVLGEAEYVAHHPKKIAFIFAAMRKFAAELEHIGWQVAYAGLDSKGNTQSIDSELLRRSAEFQAEEVLATEPGEWRLIEMLQTLSLPVTLLPDTRFLSTRENFATWAEGRKQLRMEYFYREMRRQTGLLMEDGKPVGGKWNYDHDNRKPAKDAGLFRSGPLKSAPDDVVSDVLDLVEERFADNFGDLRPFWFATDRRGAQAAFDHFVTHRLAEFGDYQDAMLAEDPFLSHAIIGLYLNAGLLDPLEVCRRAERAYYDGSAPLNAVEGFIRQIIGWREFIRGIYFHQGADYPKRNALDHTRPLPAFYWGAPTKMRCVDAVVAQTQAEAYAHHIQRLMVTGNFALLAGVHPFEVHEWYLAVYADAYEWVESPNVIGMSQFADGGVVGSKPYISSGAYIQRMSDYCADCAYDVRKKTGLEACPFNLLYWHFLVRHRERLGKNPRLAQVYRTWDRMDDARRAVTLQDAEAWLARLDAGETV
ncbi:MAG: cryptochrome/photolyase family protein [Pseudomonadota bacterium]